MSVERKPRGGGGTGLTWGGAPLAGATPGDGGPQGVGLHTIDRFLTRGRQAPGGGALTGSWLACVALGWATRGADEGRGVSPVDIS